jgi:hypothetical protein
MQAAIPTMILGLLPLRLPGDPSASAAGAPHAWQQAGAPQAEEGRWTFTVEPFLWLAGIDGEGGDGSAPPVDVGENLSIFGQFDGGFLLSLEARAPEDRFSLLADGLYLSLADDEGSLQTDTDVWMFELGGGLPLGDPNWEVIAGLRYVDLGFDTDVAGLSTSSQADWVDPWIGARGTIPLGESWALKLRADVGGFGVGTQFTWQAVAGVQAALGKSVRLDLGYRTISLDFDDSGLEYDAVIRGPLIALAFQF